MEFTGERYINDPNDAQISYEHWHRYLYATQFIAGKDVLDIACGEGYGAELLSRTAKSVTGIDISKEAVDYAKSKYIKSNLEFLEGSVDRIPVVSENKFDIIISYETIEHVNAESQVIFLKEVKRLLRDSGIFIVSSPNRLFYSDIPDYKNEFHVKEFYEEEFRGFLKGYFKNVVVLGQKVFTGSNLWNLDPDWNPVSFIEYRIDIKENKIVIDDKKKEPLYMIAVCSDSAVKAAENSLLTDSSMHIIREKDNLLGNYERMIEERDKQITDYLIIFEERDKQIESYASALADRERHIKEILNSKSWKITKPIRLLQIFFAHPYNSILRTFLIIADKTLQCLPVSSVKKNKIVSSIYKKLPFLSKWINTSRQQTDTGAFYSGGVVLQDAQLQRTDFGINYTGAALKSAASDASRMELVKKDLIEKLQVFLKSDERLEFPICDNPVVSVIILLYNRAEMSLQCLQSLKAETGNIPFEVIIIDNNSKDDTSFLLERIRNVKIIRNSHNLGFGGGCNQGAARASGKYLLFLNNDAQVLPNSIKILSETLENDSNVGAAGGKLIFPDGRLQEAGGIIWYNGSCSSYGRNDNDPFKPEYSFVRDVDFCSGAFLITPRHLFNSLGGFDIRYSAAYYEDADYCMSVWKNNLRVVFQPFAAAIHNEFGSSSERKAISLQIINHEKFADKWKKDLHIFSCRYLSETIFYREHKSNNLRVLFIDDQIPDYRLGSGFPRTYQMLRILAELGYRVTFFPNQLSVFIPEITDSLQKKGVEVIFDRSSRRISLESFLKSRPDYYSIIFISRPHNMQQSIELIKNNEKKAAILYDAEALYSLREIKFNELKGISLSEDKKNKMIKSEIKLFNNADLVMAVSGMEKEYFLKFGTQSVHILGHAVEPNPTPAVFEERKDILFVGGILEKPSPNEDAVFYFVNHILPLIRKKIDCHFYIVGTNRVKEIWNLQSDFIHVMGTAEELISYYNRSRLFVVPTRYSAGIPLKLVEAAAFGLPAVVTPLILKQTGWQENQDVLVGYDHEDFARKVIELYKNRDTFYLLRQNALNRVREEYSYDHFKEMLKQIINIAVNEKSK